MLTITITDNRLRPFYQQNADFDILGFDFSNQANVSQLNWIGMDQLIILNQLKQYQRLLRLNPDPEVAQALLGASTVQASQLRSTTQPPALNSALGIAALPIAQFVQKYGALVGGDVTAQLMHEKATAVAAQAMHLWANVHNQVASPYTQSMRVNNVSAGLAEFADLPGYQDLFGSLNYCECDECASIFGPAAYFVDLLRVIDQYITSANGNIPAALTLNNRRPDLVDIELTCANTNDLVPYLDIITNILAVKAKDFFTDNAKPQGDVYAALATQTYPFNLPFNLPLEQVRRYLGQMNTDLATIYRTFNASDDAITRETLGLSLEEYTLLTTTDSSIADISKAYGLALTTDPVDVLKNRATFQMQTRLSSQALQDLLTQNLSIAELGEDKILNALFINQLVDNEGHLQLSADGSAINNLNLLTLDRLQRFIRLAGKLNWSFADLDWVLRSLAIKDIDAATIKLLAQVKQLQTKLKLPLDVLCSFWYDIKTVGAGTSASSQALFDTLFNTPGQMPMYHPLYALDPLYQDAPLQLPAANTRVAAGLRRSLADVSTLVKTLWPAQPTIDLTLPNLSLLYRHSLCATILKQPLDAYFLLLRLINKAGQGSFSATDLLSLCDLTTWLVTSSFTVYELAYILLGTQSNTIVPKYQEKDIEPFLSSLQNLSVQNPLENDIESSQEQLLIQALATFMQSDSWKVEAILPWIVEELVLPTGVKEYLEVFFSDIHDRYQLVSFWPLDEGTGTSFLDRILSMRGDILNDANQNRRPTSVNWSTVTDFPAVAQRSVLSFGNDQNYVRLPLTAFPQGNEITVSFWVKGGPLQSSSAIWDVPYKAGGQRILNIHLPWVNGHVIFDAGNDADSYDRVETNTLDWANTFQGKWSHWTFTKNATTGVMGIYCNGALMQKSDPGTKMLPLPESGLVYLGMMAESGQVYQGTIADLRVWDVALTAEEVFDNYQTPFLSAAEAYIHHFMDALARMLVLAEKVQLSATELESVRDFSNCYGFPASLHDLALDNVRALTTFKQLTLSFHDTQDGLIEYFALATTSTGTAGAFEDLMEVTDWSLTEATEVATHLNITINKCLSVNDIAQMKQAFDLNVAMGATFAFHTQLLALATEGVSSTSWNDYTAAAHATLDLVRARYTNEDWTRINDSVDGVLNELTRNALSNFVLWKLDLPDLRRLSEYLLIDVEMSGSASISLIKQGILSAQMYLQRSRMNLEPGVNNVQIPDMWWEWLMSYQIWQANRKVFLYPENYLEPTLRKNKTELFQTFESELLQANITPETVDTAYRHYLDSFEQLAQMQIVESYRCFVPQPDGAEAVDTLFLFGHSLAEPTTFYSRTCVNPTLAQPIWSPWLKIELTIQADDLAPVFAFNKLFLFWIEAGVTSTSTEADGKKTTIQKRTVKYAFQTFSGTWSQPQTLIENLPISVDPQTYTPFGIDLSAENLAWKKPYALALPANDKILIMFGEIPALPTSVPPAPAPTDDQSVNQFYQRVYTALQQGYAASQRGVEGYQTLFPAITLTSNLLNEIQFLLLPMDTSGTVLPMIGDLDATTFRLETANPIVRANYFADNATSSLMDGLISYWPLDEGTGTTLHDIVSGHDGTIVGTSSATNWPLATDFLSILPRHVLQLGKKGNYVTFPPTSLPTGKEITISFWVYVTEDTFAPILSARDTSPNTVLRINVAHNISFGVLFMCPANNGEISEPWPGNDLNKWVHWTFIKNATTSPEVLAIYRNGELWQSTSGKMQPLPVATQFQLGQDPDEDASTDTYPGQIAELRIWNKALSSEEILFVATSVRSGNLLETVTGQNTVVQTVKNQPDWSILASDGEAFLVLPPTNLFKPISENITVQGGVSSPLTVSWAAPQGENPTQFLFTRLTTSTIRQLSQKMLIGGVDQLLTIPAQLTPEPDFARFGPSSLVIAPTTNTLDFHGPYGVYFQEIFFYLPFLIADTLNTNQNFAEAQKWYHYIFNPTAAQTSSVQSSALASYFPLNESSTLQDLMHNLAATVIGQASWPVVENFPASPSRSVLQFNAGNYATLPPASFPAFGLQHGKEITVSFWTCWHDVSGTSPLFARRSQNSNLRTFNVHIPYLDYHVYFDCGDNGSSYDRIAWNLGAAEWGGNYAGKWTHWTFTKKVSADGTDGVMKIYVNGQLKHSEGGKKMLLTVPDEIFLAHDPIGTTYDGKLAELRVWSVALSDTEVLLDYYGQPLDRFWGYLPFRDNTLQSLTETLQDTQAIAAYNNDPFDPDAIAQLRVGAYQKSIVMKYIDNILDWGDSLFIQDSWESITQAIMLYMLAYDLLGPRPEDVGSGTAPNPQTFADIKTWYQGHGEAIPQFLLELEQIVGASSSIPMVNLPFNEINAYFCVGENKQFIAYWDRVADRLYKIRHGQNIAGVGRQIALFEPALNPADLMRAAAAGVLPLDALAGLTAEVPVYRFASLLERAKSITGILMQLGSTLLNVLEKKDVEQFSRLRASQDTILLQLIKKTKQQQINAAQAGLDALQKSLIAAQHREDYYQNLMSAGWSLAEDENITLMSLAIGFQLAAIATNIYAAPLYGLPNIFGAAVGGSEFGMGVSSIASSLDGSAAVLNQSAGLSSTVAQFQRRAEEWQQQLQMAQDDINVITQQIAAAQFGIEIATNDLATHEKSMEQASQIEDFLKRKFTNQELYQWMINRLSVVYFQTFKLALDMALQAQKAYQYELTQDDAYITFDYWDDLRQGLLAGEGLLFGLTQLEKAYLDRNVRRMEIEKTISLLQLDPLAFLSLRNTGQCTFQLTERLFDLDFPGHYCRQIKSIALSIPAIVGPYQNIQATLTQNGDRTLVKADLGGVNYLLASSANGTVRPDEMVLRSSWWGSQHIALSRGVNDGGLFELNFRDERYLPFEGTGAVSEWTLTLPKATNRFDFESLSDVIIHLSYTSLVGDDKFKGNVQSALGTFTGGYYLNCSQSFPSAWHTFLSTQTDPNNQQLHIPLPTAVIPSYLTDAKLMTIYFQLDLPVGITITSAQSFIAITLDGQNIPTFTVNSVTVGSVTTTAVTLSVDNYNLVNSKDWIISIDLKNAPASLLKDGFLDPAILQNIECIVSYEGEIQWT